MRSNPSLQRLPRSDVGRLLASVPSVARSLAARLSAWRRTSVGLRGTLVSLLALPLVLAAIVGLASGDLVVAVGSVGAWVLILFGARLNRRGLLERLVAPDRRFTQAKGFPYQHAAPLIVALGVGLAAYSGAGHGLSASMLFALLAAAGMVLTYGNSFTRLSQGHDVPDVEDASARRALEDAEERLLAIERSALAVGNPELQQRLLSITKEGHRILTQLAERPTVLHRLRRFLNVHLEGAERVTVEYVRMHRVMRGGVLEFRFRDLLLQIEAAFRRQNQALHEDKLTDLDIQIDVLRKQLKREGLS